MKVTKTLKNKLEELTRARHLIQQIGAEHKFVSDDIFDCVVSLEEVLINIITYGYKDDLEHEIILSIEFKDKVLTIEVEDDGVEFNPLSKGPIDIEKDLMERSSSGLGIHLLKKLVDEIKYQRQDGKNYLIMKKNITIK